MTIKGIPDPNGVTRFEWEKVVPVTEAEALLKLCEEGVIEKTRYEVKVGKHVYEVDEFHGVNAGLIVAEIELTHPEENFKKLEWLGKEVTGELRYYNSQLSKRPFNTWI